MKVYPHIFILVFMYVSFPSFDRNALCAYAFYT